MYVLNNSQATYSTVMTLFLPVAKWMVSNSIMPQPILQNLSLDILFFNVALPPMRYQNR